MAIGVLAMLLAIASLAGETTSPEIVNNNILALEALIIPPLPPQIRPSVQDGMVLYKENDQI